MFFVNYNVAIVSATGRVIPKDNAIYTDAATIKQIKLDIAGRENVSPEAVVVSEVSRMAVA
ncbi:hypothetical protein CPT_Pepon015 [Stenotrophomonas phage Pepon]|uniref:Uncharacterized protein n=1 Tax=Stenotrophomonas phage Pepon TaxID=2859654 RepID=A0AAE7WM47_9CAUD|nr:hypothetical protein CPT_Pepon015 [Stenotrophomonas phage Pepon]